MSLKATSVLAFLFMMISIKAFAETNGGDKVVRVDGSSTVYPITEGVAEEFMKETKNAVKVTVGVSGTGGGFKKFCRGETDVQDASRPIQESEMEDCKKTGVKYFELPVAYDAIAIVVNPKNTWINEITVDELKKIWAPEAQGKITKWNQVNPKWAEQPLKLFGAGADSGTFDYFTEAVVGKPKSSRGDYTASTDHNADVTGVANEKNSLGFMPFSYYVENKGRLKIVGVVGGEKTPTKGAILPSRETVEKGKYVPLSRPIFIYVNEASSKRSEVTDFVKFYIKNAPSIVTQVKYIPLPQKAYDMAEEHYKKGKLGTVFGGHSEVGFKIEDLMKREGKL